MWNGRGRRPLLRAPPAHRAPDPKRLETVAPGPVGSLYRIPYTACIVSFLPEFVNTGIKRTFFISAVGRCAHVLFETPAQIQAVGAEHNRARLLAVFLKNAADCKRRLFHGTSPFPGRSPLKTMRGEGENAAFYNRRDAMYRVWRKRRLKSCARRWRDKKSGAPLRRARKRIFRQKERRTARTERSTRRG